MRMLGEKTVLLLLLTAVLAALLPATAATVLRCYCSDCLQNQTTCSGEVCAIHTIFHPETGEKTAERWRCLNGRDINLCNISSPLVSVECCNTHDFCNYENYTSVSETGDLGCETGNLTGNYSAGNLTTNCTESEDDGMPPETSTTHPPEERFQCYEAESTNPHTFNFSFCETTSTCFISLRVRSDGSRIYKWGCSRDDPAHPCLEEDRNRKKKTCCHGDFCNEDVPASWLPRPPPPEITPDNSTRPPPPDISTDSPSPGEEKPENCTLAQGGASSDIKPCIGPGSTIELIPSDSDPDTTEIKNTFCYCTTCKDNYICSGHFGCGIQYDYTYGPGGPEIAASHFCLTQQDFLMCGIMYGFVCCLTNFCNSLHPLNDTLAPPTENDTMATAPITAATTEMTSDTEGSPTGQPTNQNAVNPSSPATSVNYSETELEGGKEEEEEDDMLLLFYALIVVLGVLLLALVLVMVILVFCCYGYQKKKRMKHISSSRRQQITVATRKNITPTTGVAVRPTFTMERQEEGKLCSKMAESSKVEHSCTTESSYTQPSSPESTV